MSLFHNVPAALLGNEASLVEALESATHRFLADPGTFRPPP